LLDLEQVHVSVEQALTPKKLSIDANWPWHLAGAYQGPKMTFGVAEVLRRVARLEIWVAGGVVVLVHRRPPICVDQ
jgi:hypothetical protein